MNRRQVSTIVRTVLTEGLDSQGAFNIVRLLRKFCDSGHAILCTLHQPSVVLFEFFDDLLLLQSSGQTVYFGPLGPKSETLIGYFERNGAPKCQKDTNPAEYCPNGSSNSRYMLDAIGAGAVARTKQNWAQIWVQSNERTALMEKIRTTPLERSVLLADDKEYAMSLFSQIIALSVRTFTSYWRDPHYLLGK